MHNGWSLAVKVVQTKGHVVKYGVADLLGLNTVRIDIHLARVVGRNSMTRIGT